MTQFDLSQLNLGAGTHSISVRARAVGYITSDPSSAKNFYVYSVTGDATNATIEGNSEYSSTIAKGKSQNLVLNSIGNYKLPASVTINGTTCPAGSSVAGCRYTKTVSETAGLLMITNASQNLSVVVGGTPITYALRAVSTFVVVNGQSGGYSATINKGSEVTVLLTAEPNHSLPQTININGQTCQVNRMVDGARYLKQSDKLGSVYISSASMDITLSIVGD